MLVTIRTILGIICLVLCMLDICFLIKIRRTMKMESLTKEDILLKDSLTYKELMKSAGAQMMWTWKRYYLRFWLGICRTSLAVSALRIMRYCLKSIKVCGELPK